MRKLTLLKSIIVIILFVFSSCVMDSQSDIAIVKNNTPNLILIAKQRNEIMTDSILYYERFSETWVDAGSAHFISLPNTRLHAQPDSAKIYLFIFNHDSLQTYQSSKRVNGIVKSCFLKKIVIQVNKVKEPLDTIYVK